VLEVKAGPYSPQKARRAVVVSVDPERLPRLGTWYLTTDLPAPGSERAKESELAPASVAEVVRLFGLRMWVEQSYKQVKHALGFSDYQVRSDTAIRRHWQLVCCAFSFCWWAYGHLPVSPLEEPTDTQETLAGPPAGRGKKEASGVLAGGVEGGQRVAGALRDALAILERVYRSALTQRVESAA
jgi:hypothetical protein